MSLRRRDLPTVLALLLACSKAEERPPSPRPAPSTLGPSGVPSSSARAQAPAAPRADPVCRVVTVVGEGKLGDTPLRKDAIIDGSEWARLEPGAKLTLKHSTSGRELAVEGPARFRACRRGREQLLLASGTVTSAAGTGARPGAEVLIATPIAAIHFANADLTLALDTKSLKVNVRSGRADIDPLPAPKPAIETSLSAPDKLVLPWGKPDPNQLMAECKAAAEEAQTRARRVTDRRASEPLGERAQAHVRARKVARSACAVAAAATGLVADPEQSAGLWAEAVRWEALWESVPRRESSPAPEK